MVVVRLTARCWTAKNGVVLDRIFVAEYLFYDGRLQVQTRFAKTAKLLLIVIVLPLNSSSLRGGSPGNDTKDTPAAREQPPTVSDLKARLSAGTFKLTETEVVKHVGQTAEQKRPGENRSELTMNWNYATYIYATFKEGKLTEITGAFSENLPTERVTLANFKRARVGMTEPQVVDVLGQEIGKRAKKLAQPRFFPGDGLHGYRCRSMRRGSRSALGFMSTACCRCHPEANSHYLGPPSSEAARPAALILNGLSVMEVGAAVAENLSAALGKRLVVPSHNPWDVTDLGDHLERT